MTELLYFSSSPVLKVDGEAQQALARDLLRLEIGESTEGLKTLKAVLVGPGPTDGATAEVLQYLDGEILDFGKSLYVSIGPPGSERIVFDGLVSALQVDVDASSEAVVTVFAEDKLMKLRMTRRMKTYEQMSDADIAQEIASQNGLSADVAVDGPTYDVVQQWNQSDLAFLRERAALMQAEIWMDGDTLNFKSRPNRQATELTLVFRGDLIDARVRADLAHQRTSEGERLRRPGARRDRRGSRLGGDRGGDQQRLDRRLDPPARVRRPRLLPGARDAARRRRGRAWAHAEMLRRSRRFVTIEGTTSGTPDLVVGSKVTLQGIADAFNGDGYYVTRVTHTYDLVSGHRTHFCAERPTVGSGTL